MKSSRKDKLFLVTIVSLSVISLLFAIYVYSTHFNIQNETVLSEKATNWWNSDWTSRKKLTFLNEDQREDLINYPVAIKLNKNNFDFGLTQPYGEDIRFLDADGKTSLSFEVNSWDLEKKEALIWVSVPKIDRKSNKDFIYLYYGNSLGSLIDTKKQTWDKNFLGVWHFEEDPTVGLVNQIKDSTLAGRDLSARGYSSSHLVSSLFGNASDTHGFTRYMLFEGDNSVFRFMPTQDFTASVWVNLSEGGKDSDFTSILGNVSTNTRSGFQLRVDYDTSTETDDKGRALFVVQDAACCQNTSSLPVIVPGIWYYMVGVRSGSTFSMYVDGKLVDFRNTGTVSFAAASANLVFGRDAAPSDWFTFKGIIEEARISNTARSSSWINADYLSGTDQFIKYDGSTLKIDFPEVGTSSNYIPITLILETDIAYKDGDTLPGNRIQLYIQDILQSKVEFKYIKQEDKRYIWNAQYNLPLTSFKKDSKFEGTVEVLLYGKPLKSDTHFNNIQKGFPNNKGISMQFFFDLKPGKYIIEL